MHRYANQFFTVIFNNLRKNNGWPLLALPEINDLELKELAKF
jgi:hypothetical protein